MRFLLVLSIIIFSLPLAIFQPFIGVVVWCWIALFRPQDFAWGAHGLPFAQMVAAATFLGCLIKRNLKIYFTKQSCLLLILWLLMLISSFFAIDSSLSYPKLSQFNKIFLFTFLISFLVVDLPKLRIFFLMIALSLGFVGAKAGLYAIFYGSKIHGYGGFFAGENDLALGLNMVAPLLYYQAFIEERFILRLILISFFVCTLACVVFTYSRGGFLGLSTCLGLIIWKSKRKILFLPLFVALILFLVQHLPEQYIQRVQTIKTYQQDQSAMNRIYLWKRAIELTKQYPWTGVGLKNFEQMNVLVNDVHNSHLQILVEVGIPAFIIFELLILSTIFDLRKIRIATNDKSFQAYANMLEISFVVYLIEGTFLNRHDSELLYYLIGGSISLIYIFRQIGEKSLEPHLRLYRV